MKGPEGIVKPFDNPKLLILGVSEGVKGKRLTFYIQRTKVKDLL